jgi:hypothetical protein
MEIIFENLAFVLLSETFSESSPLDVHWFEIAHSVFMTGISSELFQSYKCVYQSTRLHFSYEANFHK